MIADIIIIATLALSTYLGYKKGLIELGVKVFAVIIALVATLILYRPLSNIIINTTNLDETIQQKIIKKSETTQNTEQEGVISEIKNQILPETAKEISYNIIRTGVMFILYIIIKIALKFVTILANLIAKLPILEQFNELGGTIYGIIRGLILIYAVLLIIELTIGINTNNKINEEIENSIITKEMYKYNIIKLLVWKNTKKQQNTKKILPYYN